MHPFYAVVVSDPKRARAKIVATYVAAKACQGTTAQRLGAGLTTFRRWVAQLGLGAELARLEEKARREGWHHGRVGGRPKNGAKVETENGSREKSGQPDGRRDDGKRARDGRA